MTQPITIVVPQDELWDDPWEEPEQPITIDRTTGYARLADLDSAAAAPNPVQGLVERIGRVVDEWERDADNAAATIGHINETPMKAALCAIMNFANSIRDAIDYTTRTFALRDLPDDATADEIERAIDACPDYWSVAVNRTAPSVRETLALRPYWATITPTIRGKACGFGYGNSRAQALCNAAQDFDRANHQETSCESR